MKPSIIATVFFIFLTSATPTRIGQRRSNANGNLVARGNWDVTRNELSSACKPVTVIFARGTIELGNVGNLAGPPFFNALDDAIGATNVAYQGVDYPADVLGYLAGGSTAGAAKLASLTTDAASKCPDTQIVLSGYSQGAQVVHLGVDEIASSVAARVSAVVLFGDPKDGQPLKEVDTLKVDTFCFNTDLICDGLPIVLGAHLSYAFDASQAAAFVKSHVTV
ncbi:MAG: hypothetical protein M1812_006560 [Candelaria pacifica]|nr:MAG: hypothetical protein M1812_006560 [Candelaria pacifica]